MVQAVGGAKASLAVENNEDPGPVRILFIYPKTLRITEHADRDRVETLCLPV